MPKRALLAALEDAPAHPYYQKFHKGEMINSQAKKAILNVYHHILRLDPNKSVASIALETALFTGVSKKTVLKLRQEKRKSMEAELMEEAMATVTGEMPPVTVEGNVTQLVDATDPSAKPVASAPPLIKKSKKSRPPSPRSIIRKRPGIQKKRLDRYDQSVLGTIRERFGQYVEGREKPTITEFLVQIKSDHRMPSFTIHSFRRLLGDMGLTFGKPRPKATGGSTSSPLKKSTFEDGARNSGHVGGVPHDASLLCDKNNYNNYDEAILTAIRLKLHCHGRSIAPSFEQFYREVNEDPNLPNFTRQTFLVILNDMGLNKFIKGL